MRTAAHHTKALAAAALAVLLLACTSHTCADEPRDTAIRIATFNVGDLRTHQLRNPSDPRARAVAAVIQQIRPTVILLTDITYDTPGGPDGPSDAEPGQNAQRFVDNFLAVSQGQNLRPLDFKVFTAPVNRGMPSGFDLDRDGTARTEYPEPPPPQDHRPLEGEALAYAHDAWGHAAFPGRHGMALLVNPNLELLEDRARTFRLLPWAYMPGARLPEVETDEGRSKYHTPEELEYLRLSSTSHWDVPIRLPNRSVLHLLCSFPTAPDTPAPDGHAPRRHHDEIRFWADYIDREAYIVDDQGNPGGLRFRAPFVILGTLNAEPDDERAIADPIGLLTEHRRVRATPIPQAEEPHDDLDPVDTHAEGARLDYLLPSTELRVLRNGVWRQAPRGVSDFPSDHYPVWADVAVPPPGR